MDIDPAKLGDAIREFRQLRKLTQSQVAKEAGLTVTYLSLLENGRRQVRIETINALGRALDMPPAFLLVCGTQDLPAETPYAQALWAMKQLLRMAFLEVHEPAFAGAGIVESAAAAVVRQTLRSRDLHPGAAGRPKTS